MADGPRHPQAGWAEVTLRYVSRPTAKDIGESPGGEAAAHVDAKDLNPGQQTRA